jgi:hypothetical protein
MRQKGGLFVSAFAASRKAFHYGKTSAAGGYNS